MFRALTSSEITQLENNGCESSQWSLVTVKDGFDPSRVRKTSFSGEINLGVYRGTVTLPGGLTVNTGIYNAVLHNVSVGDEVMIRKVDQYIANYIISDYAVIYEVTSLIVEGESSFGNGVKVSVINEGGGREVTMFDSMSAHIAYLQALYRYKPDLMDSLNTLIDAHVKERVSDRAVIGEHAHLFGCGPMRNVAVGPYARIEGVAKLNDGTVNSCQEDPTFVGNDVVAKAFIFAEGARVTEGAIVDSCYIGQSVELSKQFSAENSLFFANCACFHGEACSIFAGPNTVSHHKSTLLIAALVSFLNAGSGSNQSNHLYKLGPNHQGILERGSKTASDSYMLFPMHVGAFSVVMGRHYNNSDTSDLPFSYLIEHDGESLLIPGVNLRSVGTVRDSRKWPNRDKRKMADPHDLIIYHLLTPYTVQRVFSGVKKLKEIQSLAGHSSINYFYNGVQMSKSGLEKGLQFYDLAIRRYLGNIVVNFLRGCDEIHEEVVGDVLRPVSQMGEGTWLDISGLLTPKVALDELIEDIEQGVLGTIELINERFNEIYKNFHDYERAWVIKKICEERGKDFSQLDLGDIREVVAQWIDAVNILDNMRMADAQKEFAQTAKVGYALNGDQSDRDDEYRILHGDPSDNSFIKDLQERLEAKNKTAELLLKDLDAAIASM